MNASMLRSAIHVSAIFAFYLATMMLIPGLVDLYYGNDDWRVFAASGAFIGGFSAMVAIATRAGPPVISTRFTFLLVNLLWLTFSVVAAVPLYFSTLGLSAADAVFESVSAITTTGSTVIAGLDTRPPGILLWRSMLQWFGGLGVIVLSLFILPFLKIGGSSLFRIESSDRYERPYARFSTYAYSIGAIYIALTLTCAILYATFGMSAFDAVNHALTTVSTGGFSTHDSSFGFFNDNLHWVAIVFMAIGGLPFTALVVLAFRGRTDILRDHQIYVFIAYCLFFSLMLAAWLVLSGQKTIDDALRLSLFSVVTLVTTTGFTSEDYTTWGSFAVGIALVATILGGCTGSTSGGIKAIRWMILFGMLRQALESFIYPNAVHPVRTGSVSVDERTQAVTALFVATFLIVLGVGTLMLTATGLDVLTAFSGTLTAMANVGPGLGTMIGPAGNFAGIPDAAKWMLSVAMLLGRLELFAVLVLLSPAFWRG